MVKFAGGKNALARCPRCGDKVRYFALRKDGEHPELLVCPSCYDELNPQTKPITVEDGVALRRPAPDIDDDSPGDSGEDLVTALGFDTFFGGGT